MQKKQHSKNRKKDKSNIQQVNDEDSKVKQLQDGREEENSITKKDQDLDFRKLLGC